MTVQIAICDDNYKDGELIRNIIDMYFTNKCVIAKIDYFSNAEKMLLSKKEYYLIILDILLKDENGLDIARRVHNKVPFAKIIFYSTEVNFAPKSYECHGDGFIVKPPIKKDIYLCLDRVFRTIQDNIIIFKEHHGTMLKVNLDKIFYIKSDKRYTYIHLYNRRIKCIRNILEWQEKLPEKQFMLCTRGVLVNLHAITINEFDYVCFSDGSEIKIAERVRKEFRESYSAYWGQFL